MLRIYLNLLLLGFLFSCASDRSDQLIGQWSAVSVTQDKAALDVDITKIGFAFNDQGNYHFTSTLDYTEAGYYRVEGDKLFTTDTLHTKKEKAVLIEKLDSDSLKLRMKNKEGWMNVTLSKN